MFLTKEKIKEVGVERVHVLCFAAYKLMLEKNIYFLSLLQWRAECHMFHPHT